MLNGRNYVNNEFTSVSTKGSAVVDYCILQHDDLNCFNDFTVVTVTDLINSCGDISVLAPTCIPDHSLLSWNIACNYTDSDENVVDQARMPSSYDKFDLDQIPASILTDETVIVQVNATIDKLEQSFNTQIDIDTMYTEWCDYC